MSQPISGSTLRRRVLAPVIFCLLSSTFLCHCSSGIQDKYDEVTALMKERRWDEAVAFCTKQLQETPGDSLYYAYRGVSEREHGDFEKAEADLLKSVEANPKTGWCYRELGSTLLNRGKYEEAIQYLSKAKELETDKSHLAFISAYIALAELNLLNYEKAQEGAEEAIKLAPNASFGYLTRGQLYLDTFEYERALADANRAVELDDKNPRAYTLRAWIYLESDDWKKAKQDSERALQINKDFWEATEMLSAISLSIGNSQEASELAEQLIKRFPDAAVGYADKATCLLIEGNLKEAQALADKALSLQPESTRALQISVLIAVRNGDKPKLAELLERLKKAFGANERKVAKSEAFVALFLKDYPRVVRLMNPEKYSKAPQEYRLRAEAYSRMNKHVLAEEDMKKALEQKYSKVSVFEQYLKM